MTLVTPAAAQAFRDLIGVVSHVTYFDTAYGQWDKVLAAAKDIGIRRFRDGAYCSPPGAPGADGWNAAVWDRQEKAGKQGIKFCFATGNETVRNGDTPQLARQLNVIAERLRPYAAAIEGPNEYDIAGDPDWVPHLRAHQTTLYVLMDRNRSLKGLPVIGPSFATWDGPAKCGDLSAFLNCGNLHPYTGATGEAPPHMASEKARMAAVSKEKPLAATEHGYHNALKAGPQHQPPASEKAAATYLLRAYLEHWKAGIRQSYAYELLDEFPDPSRAAAERHFGLLRSDFTLKPCAVALKNLIGLLGPDGAPSPKPLDIAVSDPAVRSLVLQRANGPHLVVLWRNVSVWDRDARKDLDVAPSAFQVALPAAKAVQLALPVSSDAVHPTGFSKGRLSLCLMGEPVVLLVT